jgi:hypothetical protein
MNKALLQIAARRERIVALVALQRGTLAQNVEPWRIPLALADHGITAVRYLKRHPEGIAGVAVLLVALRPGRIATWLGRGWVSWQLLQSLRSK